MPRIWKPLNKSVQTQTSKARNVPQILKTPIRPLEGMIFSSWNCRWGEYRPHCSQKGNLCLEAVFVVVSLVPKRDDFVSWSRLHSDLEISWFCTPFSSNVLCWFRFRAPLCVIIALTHYSSTNFYALYYAIRNRGSSSVVRGKWSPPKFQVVLEGWMPSLVRSNCGEIWRPWANVGIVRWLFTQYFWTSRNEGLNGKRKASGRIENIWPHPKLVARNYCDLLTASIVLVRTVGPAEY